MSVTISGIRGQSMNLANGNFSTLWHALGLSLDDWCGEVDPRTVLTAIRTLPDGLLCRATVVDAGEDIAGNQVGAYQVDYGIDADRAKSYIDRLTAICNAAEREETKIQWS